MKQKKKSEKMSDRPMAPRPSRVATEKMLERRNPVAALPVKGEMTKDPLPAGKV